MYLLNGEISHSIEISDRGFQYGDGLFETIEVLNGFPVFFNEHLDRLFKGCKRLFIPPPDREVLFKEAIQVSQGSDSAVLKLIVTRGSGGRGYRLPEDQRSTRLLSLHPFPNYPKDYQQGVSIRFCNNTLGLNPALAGIKHMNRLEQIIARAEWDSPEIQEGLMMNGCGHVIEGTMSNLFLVKNNILYTPLVEKCGVEGVLRNILIFLAKKNQLQIIQKNISKDEVLSADELFITNSIIGIWPVRRLGAQQFKIGLLTMKFQCLLQEFKQKEIGNAG